MLDTLATDDVMPPRAAPMVRMQIQPVHRPIRRQRDGQPKLCVPAMALKGDSYRLKDRDLGRVPAATTDES
jgi:hypothetical protein